MRLPLLSLVLISATTAQAQLINGSFENGASGWNVPCECAPALFSSDGSPGGGSQCIALENVHLDCECMLFNVVEQPTPWITPGPYDLSGWIKSGVPGDIPGSRIAFSAGPAITGGSAIASIWSSAGTWEYVETTFTLTGDMDLLNTRISLVPDDGNEQPPTLCYFDNIQLAPSINTGISDVSSKTPAFRPNPAVDKLWVSLSDMPTAIEAIDVQGRRIRLNTFRHQGSTLEVDLSTVAPGLTTLVIGTPNGQRVLRFIKTGMR